MRTRTRSVLAGLAILIVSPVIVVMGYLLYGAMQAGYSWDECDWNGNGRTSLFEYLDAGRIGKRRVVVDGLSCTEYFAFKDGVDVKTVCPASAQ